MKHGSAGLRLAPFLFLAFSIFSLSYAQFGEVAGPVNFNVTLGSSQTLNMTIVNTGNSAVKFVATLGYLSTVINETAPNITISPSNGTVAGHTQETLAITVHMPSADTPGTSWIGIVSVAEVSNSTPIGGGAYLQAGVAKNISIVASKPVGSIVPYVILAVLLIILAAAIWYYTRNRKQALLRPEKKAPIPAAAVERRVKRGATGKAAANKRGARGRRRSTRRSSRKRSSSSSAKRSRAKRTAR